MWVPKFKISRNSHMPITTECWGRLNNSRRTRVILSHSEQHMGIMFTLLQSINTFSLPLWSGLQKHSLCPQNTLENRHMSWIKNKTQLLCLNDRNRLLRPEYKLLSPELGHSCRALAIRVLAMFFSPARNSNLTDSNLFHKTNRHTYMSVLPYLLTLAGFCVGFR